MLTGKSFRNYRPIAYNVVLCGAFLRPFYVILEYGRLAITVYYRVVQKNGYPVLSLG